jgi:hypothetical protein
MTAHPLARDDDVIDKETRTMASGFGNRADLYLDLTTWGWIHLGVGVAVVLAGFGLFTGNVLARAIAVLLAGASIIANFLYMPAYPVWALTVIAIDAFVIFAVTAHGRDLA